MKKYNIILDLDQTLISAEADEDYDFEKNKEKAKKFDFQDMDGYYIVFERPHLQKFLTHLFKNFNVCIWTAASKDYALFIIDKIILKESNRKLDYIFFSYHCDKSKKMKKGTKDLSMLSDIYKIPNYNKDNTFIIDDYDEVYKTQPNNCIIAPEFQFTEENSDKDTFLKDLIPLLKKNKINIKSINNK
jgi:TFIIF-interacting CTD phosphatase-like protein